MHAFDSLARSSGRQGGHTYRRTGKQAMSDSAVLPGGLLQAPSTALCALPSSAREPKLAGQCALCTNKHPRTTMHTFDSHAHSSGRQGGRACRRTGKQAVSDQQPTTFKQPATFGWVFDFWRDKLPHTTDDKDCGSPCGSVCSPRQCACTKLVVGPHPTPTTRMMSRTVRNTM